MPTYQEKRAVVNRFRTNVYFSINQVIVWFIWIVGGLFFAAIWFELLIWNPVQVVAGNYAINPTMVVAWLLALCATLWVGNRLYRRRHA